MKKLLNHYPIILKLSAYVAFLAVLNTNCSESQGPSEQSPPELSIENGTYALLTVCDSTNGYREYRVAFDLVVTETDAVIRGYNIYVNGLKVGGVNWTMPWRREPGQTMHIEDEFRIQSMEVDELTVSLMGAEGGPEVQPLVEYTLTPGPPVNDTTAYWPPEHILEKANQYLIPIVGETFFNQYLAFDCRRSQYRSPDQGCIENPSVCAEYLQYPHYVMAYHFGMPGAAFIDEQIFVVVDSAGNFIPEAHTEGLPLPMCLNEPDACQFPIGEADALAIAEEAGLETGIRAWQTSFHWYYGDRQTYVWTVSNTLNEEWEGYEYYAFGKVVLIDANTGAVLEIGGWTFIT